MEGSKKASGRLTDSAIKIVVYPRRFVPPQLSPLDEEAKAQLYQGLVKRCSKLLYLLCESPASSKNLPQKLDFAAKMLWRLHIECNTAKIVEVLRHIAEPQVSLFVRYLLKLAFKLTGLVIRLYAELSEYYEQCSGEADTNQEVSPDSTGGRQAGDHPGSQEGPQAEVKHSLKRIRHASSVEDPYHEGVSCDICGSHPVIGVRFKCLVCKDYDLCSSCVEKRMHNSEHELMASSNPNVFDAWRILTGEPAEPMEWSSCETLLNLLWNCLLESSHLREQLRSQEILVDIVAGFMNLPIEFWKNGAYQKAHTDIIAPCIKLLFVSAESSTTCSELLGNADFLGVLQNVGESPVGVLRISNKALLSRLISHGANIPLNCVKLTSDEAKDLVSAILETNKLSSRHLTLFIDTALLVKTFSVNPENLEEFVRQDLLLVLKSLLACAGSSVKPTLTEIVQILEQHMQRDVKPDSMLFTEPQRPLPGQQLTALQDISATCAVMDRDTQTEDEGMYELIDILLGHIVKAVPEKPQTTDDIDGSTAHSITTTLTLAYVLFSQSDMEQRSQLAEYISQVPNLFGRISSLMKFIIFCEALPLEADIILEMRLLLSLSEWTKYSPHVCMEVGKTGIIHLLNGIVSSTTQSFRLSESSAACLVMVLQTFLHCMQDHNHLWPFNRTMVLRNLLSLFDYPQIGFRVLSKLILSFLYSMMDDNELCMLELKSEEVEFIFRDFLVIERNPPNYIALIINSLINLTEIKDFVDPVQLNDPQKSKASTGSRKNTSKQRRKDTCSTFGQNIVTVVHTNVTKLSENFAAICCFESLLCSEKEVVQESASRLLWNLLRSESFSLQLLTSHDRILLMLQTMEIWSPITHVLLWQLGKRQLEVGCSLQAYCFYVQCCYQSKKYTECIEWCNNVLNVTSQQQLVNTAMLLKGKSLYYTYQRDQLLLAGRIGVMTPKQADVLQVRCYSKIEQVVMLLGKAHDYHYIDTEGSKLLDFAMLDYLREANKLGDCNRCMLCRNWAELRSSHVVPFSVLNELSTDRITDRNKQVIVTADYSLKKPITKRSARQIAHKMLCGACENRLSLNAETSFCNEFFKPITHRSNDSIPYGEWLYHFCVSMVFRGLSHHSISNWPNSGELYNVFLLCRKHLMSLPYRKQTEPKLAAESCEIRHELDYNERDQLTRKLESEICTVEKEPHPQTGLQISGTSSKINTLDTECSEKHVTNTGSAINKQTSSQRLPVQPSKKSIKRAQATKIQHANELYNYNTTGDLEINLLLLPRDVSSCPKDTLESLKDALGAPTVTNIESVQLNDGSLDYYGQAHFFLISFGGICILTKFTPSDSYNLPTETHILPNAGTYRVPKEEDLWKLLPYGVWHTLLSTATHVERSHQLLQMRASKGSSRQPSYIGESEPLDDRGWAIESLKHQGFLKIGEDSPVTYPPKTVSNRDYEGSPVHMQAQVGALLQHRRLVMNHTFLPEEFTISQYIPQQGAGHKCLVFPRGHYLLLHVTEKSEQKVVSLFLCFSANAGYGSENPYILIIIHHFQHYHLADGVFVSLNKGIKAEKFLVEKGRSSKYRLTLSIIQHLVGQMFPSLMRAKGYYSVYSLLERASTIRSPQHSQVQIPVALDVKCSSGNCWYCEDLCHCCMKPASFGYTLQFNESHELIKFCGRSCQVIQEECNPPPIVTKSLKHVQTRSPFPIQATKVIQTGACGNTVVTVQLHLECQTRRLYVLCLFRAPWQQIALDFFISDQYEPEMPVGYVLRYSTIRSMVSKSKSLLCLILKCLLHPEVQRMGYSSLTDLKLSIPCISTGLSPTHFHIPKMLSMLPAQFTFTKPEGSTPGHKCISLPEGHHTLLHYTQMISQNMWKTYFLCYSEEDNISLGTPYIVFLDGQTVKGSFISVGDQYKTANLMDLTAWSPDQLGAIQNEVDEVLPTILENCGFTSVYALFQRKQCTGRLPSSVTELSLDHRCSTEGCWYCQDLCHCCMTPVPTPRTDGSKSAFCSSKCYDLYNKIPASMEVLRSDQLKCDKIPDLTRSLMRVTTVVSTPLSKHTIVVIHFCIGDGSEGVLALHPYILCQLRTLDQQVVLDYFVSDNFVLMKPLWYAKSAIMSSKAKQIIESSLIKDILQPAITQCLYATTLITVRNPGDESAMRTQGSLLSVTPFPSSLIIIATAADLHSKAHNQLSLPEGHKVLLHMTVDQSNMTYFLCSCGQNPEKLYLLLASSRVTESQPVVGIFITSEEGMRVSGVMVPAVPALPGSVCQLISLRLQQIVSTVLPILLGKKGYLSIHSLLHRLKYSRSFPGAMLPPLDHKCSTKGCWYCRNLCHFCLQPVTMEWHPRREEQAHSLLFCSEVCRTLFLDAPSKFRSFLCFDLRNQPNQIGHLVPSPILHVLKVKPSLAYGNTVVSIILSIGDGSEGFQLGKPYILYSMRSVNKASFCEMFLSSECAPQECLPYLSSCSEAKCLVKCTQYISQAVELMGFPDINFLVCHHMLYSALRRVVEALKLFGTPL